MSTKRSRAGQGVPAGRRHVGMTLPAAVKDGIHQAAEVLEWSAGDWVLASAAEHGPRLRTAVGRLELPRRSQVTEARFTALYLTDDERDELDDQARTCGLNRSAFVTAVARLGLGEPLEEVVAQLRDAAGRGTRPAPTQFT